MSAATVDIGSKSGKFKYILVQQGQKLFVRGDASLEYHGREKDTILVFYVSCLNRSNL